MGKEGSRVEEGEERKGKGREGEKRRAILYQDTDSHALAGRRITMGLLL